MSQGSLSKESLPSSKKGELIAKRLGSLEKVIEQFKYAQQETLHANMNNLCLLLGGTLNLKEKELQHSLLSFLVDDYNIPIEVNFRALRLEDIQKLIELWKDWREKPSYDLNTIHLYSCRHSNLLFRRVLIEEKSTIDEYFTLSPKCMLKSFDIYNLLMELLSSYYLYEFNEDNEVFFEKMNSFDNFVQIVDRFVSSDKRIIMDHTKEDLIYVRRYEFAKLIEFWEQENPELQLSLSRRIAVQEKSRQSLESKVDKQIQTEAYSARPTLIGILNTTLHQLNILTEHQESLSNLLVVEAFYQSLRNLKIQVLTGSLVESSSTDTQTANNVKKPTTFLARQDFINISSEKLTVLTGNSSQSRRKDSTDAADKNGFSISFRDDDTDLPKSPKTGLNVKQLVSSIQQTPRMLKELLQQDQQAHLIEQQKEEPKKQLVVQKPPKFDFLDMIRPGQSQLLALEQMKYELKYLYTTYSKSSIIGLLPTELVRLLTDLGVARKTLQTMRTPALSIYIQGTKLINILQFQRIIGHMMALDKQLSGEVLKQFYLYTLRKEGDRYSHKNSTGFSQSRPLRGPLNH